MSALPLHIHTPAESQPFKIEALTVGQVVDWYAVNHIRADAVAEGERERRRVRALFVDDLGGRLCRDCRACDLLEWLNAQRGAASNWTRKRWAATVQTPFNVAAKLGLIDRNPFRGITFPEGDCGRDWTQAEYQTVLRESPPCYRRVVVMMRFSGMRPGEVRNLDWPWVKPESECIMIVKHKGAWRTKRPRRVPLNKVMIKLLSWCKRNNPAAAKRCFLNLHYGPWSRARLDDHLLTVRRRVGLPDDLKLHGCRHTFATGAVIHGVDIATLAQLLGHESLRTTERYLHLAGKLPHLNAAMERAVGGDRKEHRRD